MEVALVGRKKDSLLLCEAWLSSELQWTVKLRARRFLKLVCTTAASGPPEVDTCYESPDIIHRWKAQFGAVFVITTAKSRSEVATRVLDAMVIQFKIWLQDYAARDWSPVDVRRINCGATADDKVASIVDNLAPKPFILLEFGSVIQAETNRLLAEAKSWSHSSSQPTHLVNGDTLPELESSTTEVTDLPNEILSLPVPASTAPRSFFPGLELEGRNSPFGVEEGSGEFGGKFTSRDTPWSGRRSHLPGRTSVDARALQSTKLSHWRSEQARRRSGLGGGPPASSPATQPLATSKSSQFTLRLAKSVWTTVRVVVGSLNALLGRLLRSICPLR